MVYDVGNSKTIMLLMFFLVWKFSVSAQNNLPVAPPGMLKVDGGLYNPFFKTEKEAAVEVTPFFLDVTAVTNEQYLAFVTVFPQWSKANVASLLADQGYLKHWDSVTGPPSNLANIKDSPVTNVSWHAANAYCKCQGKRLPTLAEWEWAATSPVLSDDQPIEKIILEWYSRPNDDVLPPVGSALRHKNGLSDMHGLIWEWVADFNSIVMDNDSRSNSAINRDLYCASGSFGASDQKDYATFMRFAFRSSLKSKYTVANLGFRCAKDADPAPNPSSDAR